MKAAFYAGSVALALLIMAGSTRARAEDLCGGGKDLVVQALETAAPTSNNDAYENALQLLKQAVESCAELGDAWYYRSLVEQRLGHGALAQYSLTKAQMLGSEAMRQGLNPFVLSTPSGRAVARGLPGGETAPGEPPASTPAVTGPVQQKWALVVGLSHFSDRAIPPLGATTEDANAFAAELKDPGIGRFPADHVKLLTDEKATTVAIKEGLNWIARQAGPNDLVVIYFATHGSPRDDDSVGDVNYLVTYDTQIGSLDHPNEDALYATSLPMMSLVDAVATRMKALRTAVILDTCFSGSVVANSTKMMGALPNLAPSANMLARMSEGTGRIVLAAASASEESLEAPEFHHGYFTYYLLQALKASKGLSPMSQIYATVAQEVSKQVEADGKKQGVDQDQHPQMSRSSGSADFALGVTAGAVASTGGRPAHPQG
jgi:uncharacterized caspase-like protein